MNSAYRRSKYIPNRFTDYSDRYYWYDDKSLARGHDAEPKELGDILEQLLTEWDGSEYSWEEAVNTAARELGSYTGSHVDDLPEPLQCMVEDLVSFFDEQTELGETFGRHYRVARDTEDDVIEEEEELIK